MIPILPILCLVLAAPLAPQDPALAKAFVTAQNQLAAQKPEAAVQTLRGAGADRAPDGAVRTRYGVFLMRWTEARIQSGDPEVAGLAAVDAWFEVAEHFAAATRLQGASDETFEHWSESLLNAGDPSAALSAVDDGLSDHRDSARLFLQRGRVLMARARKAADLGEREDEARLAGEAEQAFRKAMEQAPKSAAPCLRLAETKILRWHAGGGTDAALRQEAVDLWTQAAKREPAGVDPASAHQWLQGDAVGPLTVMLEKKPGDAVLLWFRGLAYWSRQPVDWSGLRDDLTKVLELDPKFTDANFYLGDGAMKRGNDLIAAQKPEDADKAYSAAAHFWAAYLDASAAAYASSSRQSADGGADLAQRLTWLAGRAYQPFGKPQEAASIMRFVVMVTPEDGFAWQNFAFFLRESRAHEDSRAAYARAFALLPEDPQVMNDYAVIHHYYLKNEDGLALDLYRRAKERAQQMLDTGGLTGEERNRIGTALTDATNNLRKLEAGDRRNF